MENYENAGDKNGGGDESGGFDQRSYEQSGIADARVSRKTSLNPVRVVSHPTLETSSNETTEVGGGMVVWKSPEQLNSREKSCDLFASSYVNAYL